jgi:hypothetical protein
MNEPSREGKVWIKLSLAEMIHGASIGAIRHYEAEQANRKMSSSFSKTEKDPMASHVQGAVGEIVVAKALGMYFNPTVNSFKAADLSHDIQVRLRIRHDADMGHNDNDNPDHLYVLVTGRGPEYCVHGWEQGKNIRRQEFRQSYSALGSLWFVPQRALRPVQDLINLVGKKDEW